MTVGSHAPERNVGDDDTRPSLRQTLGETHAGSEDGAPRTLGRYMLLDRLGHGAMGAVYRAYDPELDRLIAIKRLIDDDDRPAHLLHEAQAIARLSHPNVVSVHDVGEDAQTGDAFIAMELVEGGTLRAWLRERERSWREIAAAFVQAGRGLAAAHAQGVVHRDFKPENVLISASGQVKVVDFGLGTVSEAPDSIRRARSRSGRSDRPRTNLSSSEGSLGSTRSRRVGTPAYMPPEQLLGAETDRRSDQFAFAVALFEAFNDRLPFAGTTINQYAVSVIEGAPAPFRRGSPVPRRMQRAIHRAMSVDPDARFAELDELLAVLDHAPRRRNRMYALGGMAVLGSGLLAFAGPRGVEPPRLSTPCEVSTARIDAIWNDDARAAMTSAMTRVGGAFGADTAARSEHALDELAHRWRDARTDACASAYGSETGPSDPRTLCLERALDRFAGLVDALSTPRPATLEHAVEAIDAATHDLDGCNDPARLGQWTQRREHAVGPAIDDAIARARQWLALGDAQAGLAALEGLEPDELGVVGFDVEVIRGRLRNLADDLEGADEALAHAGELGVGRAVPLAAAEWNQARGDLAYSRHDYPAMDGAYRRAASLYAESLGPDDPETLEAMATRGHLHYATGDYARALDVYRQAQRRLESVVGDANLHRLSVDQWIVETLVHLGRYTEARTAGTDLRDRLERTLGPDHPRTLETDYRIGVLQLRAGEDGPALATFRRVYAAHERVGTQTAMDRAAGEANMGGALMGLGRDDEALSMYRRAEASLHEAGVDDDHPNLLAVRASVGALLDRAGEHAVAERVLAEVLRGLDEAGLQTTSNALMVRLNLARAQRALARPSDAVETLLVGIERAGRAGDPVLRGRLRHELARALDALGRGRDATAALASAQTDLADPAAVTYRRAAEQYAAERIASR